MLRDRERHPTCYLDDDLVWLMVLHICSKILFNMLAPSFSSLALASCGFFESALWKKY